MKVIALGSASGVSAQSCGCIQDAVQGAIKSGPRATPSTSTHLPEGQGHRTSSSPLHPSLCVCPDISRVTPLPETHCWEPRRSCSTSCSHVMIPEPQSRLPVSCFTRSAVSPYHSLWVNGGAPLMLTQLLLLCLGMLPPPQKGSLQVYCLLPSLCSIFNMHPYSTVQLLMGANKHIAFFSVKAEN